MRLKSYLLAAFTIFCTARIATSQKQQATTTPVPPPSTDATTNDALTSAPPPAGPAEPPSSPPATKRSPRQRLREDLLRGYDPMAHPRFYASENVTVAIGLVVIHVDVDERASTMSVDAWMRLAWRDDHLRWNPDDYGGLNSSHFAAWELWKPDIQLYNSAVLPNAHNGSFGHATHFVVSSDGAVLWVPPAKLVAYCKVFLRQWPRDSQVCPLKLGSWTSHGDQIDLKLHKEMEFAEEQNLYTDNKEWAILSAPAHSRSLKYSCCNESYPEVTFTLHLQRKSPTYTALVVMPCLVIMGMVTCAFLLPPMAGEKLMLNGFAFLGTLAYLIFFATSLPFHSSEMPIIVMFYSNTCVLVGVATILNVVCISLCRVRKYVGPPKGLKVLFSGSFGKLLCLSSYYHQTSFTHQRLVLELSDLDLAESEQQQQSGDDCGGGGDARGPAALSYPPPTSSSTSTSGVMRDWVLVAAGMERLFLMLYVLIFAVVLSVYV